MPRSTHVGVGGLPPERDPPLVDVLHPVIVGVTMMRMSISESEPSNVQSCFPIAEPSTEGFVAEQSVLVVKALRHDRRARGEPRLPPKEIVAPSASARD